MLRKMYLVSPDYINTVQSKNTPPPQPPNAKAGEKQNSSKQRSVKKIKTKNKKYSSRREHDRWVTKRSAARRVRDCDKWFKVRAKLREADVERKSQIKNVADFLKQVLPSTTSSSSWLPDAPHSGTHTELGATKRIKSELPPPRAKRRIAYKTKTPIPSTSSEVVYEASSAQPHSIKRDVDDDDYVSTDDQQIEPDMLDYGAMTVGALTSPYVSPYLYKSKKRGLDAEYGIRRDAAGFMIGDSRVVVDSDGNIHIKNVEFPATKGLWELLTRKRVDKKIDYPRRSNTI